VETSIKESPDGPARKYYKLTEQGEEMISQMNAYWQAISGVQTLLKRGKR